VARIPGSKNGGFLRPENGRQTAEAPALAEGIGHLIASTRGLTGFKEAAVHSRRAARTAR